MKKLHAFVLCAMVTPVITLGAGSTLAQLSASRNMDANGQAMQQDSDIDQSQKEKTAQERVDSTTIADPHGNREKTQTQNKGYMDSMPHEGIHASRLIGTSVRTSDEEDVGTVSDLIIDRNGQILAIVVGVGGVLGIGEKSVAIAWEDVKRPYASGMYLDEEDADDSDDRELHITATRKELRAAPEFKGQE